MNADGVLTGELDPHSDRAVFRQIADHLRDAIQRGRLPEGAKLPSEAQLVEHYKVARMTIRSALQELQTEGLVVSEHGRGVFVRRRPPVRRLASDRFARRHRKEGKAAFLAESAQVGAKSEVDMIEIREQATTAEVADRLSLEAGDEVVVRSRRYSLNGHPVETAVSYIPADIARGTPITDPNPGPGGIYARIEDMGHTLERFEEEVSARMPTPDEARILQLPAGTPVFRLVRTAFDTEGRAVEVCDTIMSADAYVLSYELPAH
ncbi:GntR family transcriptional regulator [Actinomadura macrotermitis]|uniref:Putative fructoselysine utilization operon transcriptional repressor n=1 Tax=Actinomadura macrotermitis TaxID=2585200 RepID=A0A7K0C1J9_9ACTN|nr:GntR family transcriptional regulator [Actinomadura macrotermitis]MQY07236.1 putative fructoselysine utilization operon transcriptional repressor [Actinomadura macrotermitis]